MDERQEFIQVAEKYHGMLGRLRAEKLWDEKRDKVLGEEGCPYLTSTILLANYLGVSRSQLRTIREKHPDFPKPNKLGAWRKKDVDAWLSS